jgi:hypothetical protein
MLGARVLVNGPSASTNCCVLASCPVYLCIGNVYVCVYIFFFPLPQFVDAHLSKRILHEARRQQQEIESDTGSSPFTSKKQLTKLGDVSDDSSDEAELQDDMDGNCYENIVRIVYMFIHENISFCLFDSAIFRYDQYVDPILMPLGILSENQKNAKIGH